MARINVYVPDDLAAQARAAELNVSSITQEALRSALAVRRGADWLTKVRQLPLLGVEHDQVMDALDALREEAGDAWPTGSS